MSITEKDRTVYAVSADAEKEYVSWQTVETMVDEMAEIINTRMASKPSGIFGIARGGLVPAVMLSHATGLPLLQQAQTGCLVVDDIADNGTTLKPYVDAGYETFVLYRYVGCSLMPTYWVAEKDMKWLVFPWERPSR